MSFNDIPKQAVPPEVPADIRAEILDRLAALESEFDVRILYACESGSRGWGFASPDSDWDVRFIYVHPIEWYLSVSRGRDVIETPPDPVYDINGWDVRKTLGLLKNGNATLIEWMGSPIVYRSDPTFMHAFEKVATAIYRPARTFQHYLHMARGNFKKYLDWVPIRTKKYLYVLRPLLACQWIESGRGVVPMLFSELVETLVTDPALKWAIADLIAMKMSTSESAMAPPIPLLHDYVMSLLYHFNTLDAVGELPVLTDPVPDFAILDQLLVDTVMGN